jgi:hypothetical protein
VQEAEADEIARIRFAVEQAFGRPATNADVELAREFFASAEDAKDFTTWDQYAQALLAANEFMFVD